jgi:hypothetical protein
MNTKIRYARRTLIQQWAPLCILMLTADVVMLLCQCGR